MVRTKQKGSFSLSTTGGEGTRNMRISWAAAQLSDDSAMETLLAAVPTSYAGQLREYLKPGNAGRGCHHHPETRSARYTVCDGDTVVMFTVTDVSPEEAAVIGMEWQSIAARERGFHRPGFHQAVERALGVELDLVQ